MTRSHSDAMADTARSQRPLTCLSCAYHRVAGCAKGITGWPHRWLGDDCLSADYEPGSDEREDWENE